ncbi:MAG: transglutaminase domain-containing protein [Desulfobacterales bacterium]|jgi:hypothetical protein
MKTPPLLIGAAILFWGFEMDQLMLALIMAVAIEASRWFKHRWELKDADFRAVAVLCTLALVVLTSYRFLTGWFEHGTWMILKWLPIILAPLLIAQRYSTAGRISLSVLFLFRKKQILSQHAKTRSIDLSFIYLAVCIFGAGFVNNRDGLFYVGMMGLAIWALWSYRSRQAPLAVWLVLIAVAGAAGYLGQMGLSALHTVVEQKSTGLFMPGDDSYRRYAQIGDIPDEKLSRRIVFRARPGGADEHSLLLREATYDTFNTSISIWSVSRKKFSRLSNGLDPHSWQLATETVTARSCTIAQNFKGKEKLLKLPGGAFQVDNLKVARADLNDYGAVKARGNGLMRYTAHYGPGSPLLSAPATRDLNIPRRESRVIQDIADQLDLRSLSPPEVLRKIKAFFATEFTYSLKPISKQRNLTLMQNFLTRSRSGHCEYFATATVLLLRQAGIPARYARGYSVNPSDTMGGWCLVRTRYAHAWAVAFVDNSWVNLDATPANWQEMERQQQPLGEKLWQVIQDWVSGFVFEFAQWRQKMKLKGYLKYVSLFLLPVIFWTFWRIAAQFKKGRKLKKIVVAKKEKPVQIAGSDSAFYRIEERLNDLGLKRYAWEPPSVWLNRIESAVGRKISLDIPRQLLDLHYRYRFDPRGLKAGEKLRMTKLSEAWLAEYHPKQTS